MFGQRRKGRSGTAAPAAVAMAVLMLMSTFGWPSAAQAAASGACQDETGVTVVVDFGRLGGGTQVACAAWPVLSGLDALERAGFDWTPVASQPSFVCRINDKPASDPCQVTPPSDKYWGYWEAARGGMWTYSPRGAGASQPAPGSVEGWAFGDSVRPGVPPPAPYEPPPTTSPPPTSAPPPATTGQPSNEPPSTALPTSTAPASIAATPGPTTPTPMRATPPGGGPFTITVTANAIVDSSDAEPPSGSSPVGTIVGGGLVLLVAAAGGVLAWRRRLSASE